MCGIAGIIHPAPGDDARAMIEAIAHRGPNGVRMEAGADWRFAHARLSIIDLEGGWQPLHAAGATIIGNGEIYNYLELTRDFGLGDALATGSDFEPLLHLYAQEGDAAFDRLRGMYAFCLVGGDGRVFLVRDPFGIKPLYLARRGEGLAFASEPRALAEAPAPNLDPLADVVAFNYAPGEATAFEGVTRIGPGEIWEATGGVLRFVRRRAAIRFAPPRREDEAAALDALDRVLEDSVRVHQRADVPYGLFLSGGVDSATIATLMARLNERPVVAFTCGFDAPGARDERAQAERVARALDLDWRETLFTEEDFWRLAPRVAWALDDPTADYACLPTLKLAEAARDDLTVVLSGEGGDELFAGYGRYRRALRPAWLGGRPAEPRAEATALPDRGAAAIDRWRAAASGVEGQTSLQRAQAADIATWLPADLLLKLDRCLMAEGLEGRTPFLDPEVAAFAAGLPDRLKAQGRFGKYILRKWLERRCPAAEPWAKKQGFTVPVAQWIAPRAAELGPAIAEVATVRRVCAPEAVRAIFSEDAHAAQRWPLLFLALWARIHVERATPEAALASLLPSR